jgi:hypothetical protein
MRESNAEASKDVMGPMPDLPAMRFSQLLARSLPRGVMAARPVTTTLFIFSLSARPVIAGKNGASYTLKEYRTPPELLKIGKGAGLYLFFSM